MTTWEGGLRVPMMVRWPGHIRPGTELNGIHCGEDVFVTLSSIAGAPDIKQRLAKGDMLGTDVNHRCYIDGVDQLAYWTGQASESARDIFYFYSESKFQAIRWKQWKLHFSVRSGYYGATTELEIPWFFNIRQDPFESYDQAPGPRADISQHHSGIGNIILDKIHEHLATFKDFPPRQAAATLNIDALIATLARPATHR
jgi:arylsulfatase